MIVLSRKQKIQLQEIWNNCKEKFNIVTFSRQYCRK